LSIKKAEDNFMDAQYESAQRWTLQWGHCWWNKRRV